MTLPTECLDKILRAQKTNLARISVANGFLTNVNLVSEIDVLIDDGEITNVQGDPLSIIIVTDVSEDFEYRTAGDVRSTLTYEIQTLQTVDKQLPTALTSMRTLVRQLQQDIWKAFHGDIYLSAANLANGGTSSRLVTEHRIRNCRRSYGFPSSAMVIGVVCSYDFNAYSTT